jgi:hypothetical protein
MFYIKLPDLSLKTVDTINILDELYYNLAVLDINKYSKSLSLIK